MADSHLVVVDGEGEVIGRVSIGLQQDVVVERVVTEADGAHHQVLEGCRALRRNRLTDDKTLAGPGAALGVLPRDGPAAAIVPLRLVSRPLLSPHLLEALGRTETAVCGAGFEQDGGGLRVDRLAFRLNQWRFVPVHPQPAETFLDRCLAARLQAGAVGVLDPQQELTALLPGEQIIEEGRSGAAQVQGAGWARRIADANWLVHFGHPTIVLSGKWRPLRHILDAQIRTRLYQRPLRSPGLHYVDLPESRPAGGTGGSQSIAAASLRPGAGWHLRRLRDGLLRQDVSEGSRASLDAWRSGPPVLAPVHLQPAAQAARGCGDDDP